MTSSHPERGAIILTESGPAALCICFCAYREGHEETGPFGMGDTEGTAVFDLIQQERDRGES